MSPDLASDPAYAANRGRLANADVIEARFAPQFLQRTAEEWFRAGFAASPALCRGADHGGSALQSGTSPVAAASCRCGMARAPTKCRARRCGFTVTPPKAGGVVPALGEGTPRWADEPRREPTRAQVTPGGFRLKACVSSIFRWDGAGPQATRHFADLGCDVIKVEACQYPDWWRGVDNRPIVIEQMLTRRARISTCSSQQARHHPRSDHRRRRKACQGTRPRGRRG